MIFTCFKVSAGLLSLILITLGYIPGMFTALNLPESHIHARRVGRTVVKRKLTHSVIYLSQTNIHTRRDVLRMMHMYHSLPGFVQRYVAFIPVASLTSLQSQWASKLLCLLCIFMAEGCMQWNILAYRQSNTAYTMKAIMASTRRAAVTCCLSKFDNFEILVVEWVLESGCAIGRSLLSLSALSLSHDCSLNCALSSLYFSLQVQGPWQARV